MNRIRNERIRGTAKVGKVSKKVQESRLMWYRHNFYNDERKNKWDKD